MSDPPEADLGTRIDDAGVDRIVLEFGDINGVSRSKQVTREYFERSWRSGFSIPVAIIACTPMTVPATGSGYAEERNYADGWLRPDPSTFKVVPWLENTGRVLCDLELDGEPVGGYPRTALRRVLADVPDEFDVAVGSELEFYLLDPLENGGYEPATPHEHESVSWITESVSPYFEHLHRWADAYGVPLDLLQHEHGPGQLEILFEYGEPMAQADLAFDFKRLVKQTARARGRRATFMSKPFAEKSGSGYHLHVSVERDGENALADPDGGLSDTGRWFVGGLLEHADALVALGAPTLNAFKRYQPGLFVPSTASWGYDNRMAAVRVPVGDPRVEYRIPGADANPYVVIASALAAGMHGVRAELDPGAPVSDRDPAGDRPDLETTPELALRALEADDVLCEALGREFVRAFVAVKRQDIESFRGAVTEWERSNYVEML